MEELYKSNKDFREYVDRYCYQHHITVEQALTLAVIAEYAEYLQG